MVKFFTSAEAQQTAMEMQGMVPASNTVELTDTAKDKYPLLAEFLDLATTEGEKRSDTLQATMYANLLDVMSQQLPLLASGELDAKGFCQTLTDAATSKLFTAGTRQKTGPFAVAKLQFRRQAGTDRGPFQSRPKVSVQKLSPSRSVKTEIHAPVFYEFAQQILFHARCRANRRKTQKSQFIPRDKKGNRIKKRKTG